MHHSFPPRRPSALPSGLAPEFPLPLAGLLAPFASLALRSLGVASRAFLGLAKLPAALLVRFGLAGRQPIDGRRRGIDRSEEHTSELQSLMRISYAVFCLKKKKTPNTNSKHT